MYLQAYIQLLVFTHICIQFRFYIHTYVCSDFDFLVKCIIISAVPSYKTKLLIIIT